MLAYDSPPTPYECAYMADRIYGEGEGEFIINTYTWKSIKTSSRSDTGYRGIAYRQEEKKQIVIVHRGTVPPLIPNWISNAFIALGILEFHSHHEARHFSKCVRKIYSIAGCSFFEVGHSLGAIHAELNALDFDNGKAITFDSPGISEDMLEQMGVNRDNSRISTYLNSPNIVNTANPHIGEVTRVYASHITHEHTFEKVGDYCKLPDTTVPPLLKQILLAIGSLFIFCFGKSFIPKIVVNLVEKFLTSIVFLVPTLFGMAYLFFSNIINYQLESHSMKRILNQFKSETGHPILSKKVESWPSRYINFGHVAKNSVWGLKYSYIPYFIHTMLKSRDSCELNQEFETKIENMTNYKVSKPIIYIADKRLNEDDHASLIDFYDEIVNEYNYFFNSPNDLLTLRENLDDHLLELNTKIRLSDLPSLESTVKPFYQRAIVFLCTPKLLVVPIVILSILYYQKVKAANLYKKDYMNYRECAQGKHWRDVQWCAETWTKSSLKAHWFADKVFLLTFLACSFFLIGLWTAAFFINRNWIKNSTEQKHHKNLKHHFDEQNQAFEFRTTPFFAKTNRDSRKKHEIYEYDLSKAD